ncbi:MAG: preprotein translocase subunit SecG [Oscillospiraceae bacterium]|nr:preprotein translocase subunit SecG [Oscillospiraceae bacterium]
MDTLRIVLLVMQILSCVALTAIITMQDSKEGAMGALTGNSESYMGKGKAATKDAKLASITKWIAAAFVLLTLIVSLLYTTAK